MPKTIEYYQQELALQRELDNKDEQASTLRSIGAVWSALGEQRKALDFYEQALLLSRAVGNRSVEATTLNNIGTVWHALGEQYKALDFYEQALPLLRAVGDRGGEAVTCFNIGLIYRDLGDLDKAIEYVSRCVELDEQIEHPDLESDRRMLEQLMQQRSGVSSPREGPTTIQEKKRFWQRLFGSK